MPAPLRVSTLEPSPARARRPRGGGGGLLAESGILGLSLGYRGIGDSRPASLRGFEAWLRDWGVWRELREWLLAPAWRSTPRPGVTRSWDARAAHKGLQVGPMQERRAPPLPGGSEAEPGTGSPIAESATWTPDPGPDGPRPGDRLPGLHLVVAAGGREALVPTEAVDELAEGIELEAPPVRPCHVAGWFRRRGRRLVALDLASLLGAEPGSPPGSATLMFRAGSGFGLRVDRAEPVFGSPRVAAGPAAPPGAGWRPRLHAACAGRAALPLLEAQALADLVGIRRAGAAPHRELAAPGDPELAALEASLMARGQSLCPRLRRKLTGFFAARAFEPGAAGGPPLLPTILAGEPLAVCALIESAVDGETWFFRDAPQLAALRRLLFGADPGRDLRLWSAGCASGEEAYTLAMSLAASGCGGTVLGTDVDERALAHARAGRYGRWSLRQPEPDLSRYLSPGPPPVEVLPEIRRRVEFRFHDVVDDPPGSGFDAVLCRNVLGLLSPGNGYRALLNVVDSLRPGGYLLLGASESSLADALPLERVESGGVVLLRRPWTPRRGRPPEGPPARP